ncbi:hypothetical protein PI124_g18720 [Phytophthora idaei]|nr:hypothetical protein PI124_g18720 [Phytophthora idaei]
MIVETLDKTQKEQVQRLYLREDSAEAEEESLSEDTSSAKAANTGIGETTSGRTKTAKWRGKKSKKNPRTRERHVTKSVGRNAAEGADESAQKEESGQDMVNNVIYVDPRNCRDAIGSRLKREWLKALLGELGALEASGAWDVVRPRRQVRVLRTKRAVLVAFGKEQEFDVNYGITFAAVVEMTSDKLILVLARKWRVPAKHGGIPNAYAKAEK